MYSIIHAISLVVVFAHLLAFSIYYFNQESLNHITPSVTNGSIDDQVYYNETTISTAKIETIDNFDEVYAEKESNIQSEYDLIWILLTLSLCSICLHIVILLHVRSTAPTNDVIRRKFEESQSYGDYNTQRKRKMLAYWVYDRYRNENNIGSMHELKSNSFGVRRNAVHTLSPVQSAEKSKPKFKLEPDLSTSDGDSASDDLLSSDYEEGYFDIEEDKNGTESFDNNDYHQYFFSSEEELNNFESPQRPHRRRRLQHRSTEPTTLRGLVYTTCFSRHGYDGKFANIYHIYMTK